jgi:hypothetical protein
MRRFTPLLTKPLLIRQTTIFFFGTELFHPFLLFRSQNQRLIGRHFLARRAGFAFTLRPGLAFALRAVTFRTVVFPRLSRLPLSAALRLAALRLARLLFAARTPFLLMGLDCLFFVVGRLFLLFRGFLAFRLVLLAENRSDFLD